MPSHTIKVTGVSDDLLELLDRRVREVHSTGRAEYVRELIRKDVLPHPRWPAADVSFAELVEPLQRDAEASGETEEELEEFIRQQIAEHRRSKSGV
jgi:hypothetical protein